METSFVHNAAGIIAKPEVQDLIKKLSEHGLAVCVPHMHRDEDGSFVPLPEDTVQSESDLKVSFVKRAALDQHDIPVAWRWNEGLEVVQSCRVCRADGPHH